MDKFLSAIYLSIIFGIIGLGAIILLRGPKNRPQKLFLLFDFSVVLWASTNYLLRIIDNPNIVLFILRLNYACAALMIYSLFIFSLQFPKKLIQKTDFISLLILLPALIIVWLSISSFLVISFDRNGVIINPQYGTGFLFFVVFALIYLIFILIISYYQYKTSSGILKQQARFLFLGILFSALIAVVLDLIIPLFFNNNYFANFDILGIVCLVGMGTYAILKHHLFDIRVIATEALVVAIVLVLLIQIFLSKTWTEGLLRGAFLVVVTYFGYLLIQSVIQEIERRKEVERLSYELELANKHLQELDKMKTEFVSIASHDLLTPISAIQGYLSMILDENIAPVENEKARDYLSIVYASANRLAKLVQDLLNVSRIDQGRLVIDRRPITIEKSIQHVYDELEIKAKKQGLELVWEKPEKPLPKVLADPDKVQEVLSNLIGNAIKFTKTGSVKIKTEIIEKDRDRIEMDKMGEDKDRDYVVVHIQDTGVGIPKEEIPNLFQKFHRVGSWVTREAYGTGLGLYIAKSMVTLMGGKIWCESEEGKGSTFSFSLPVAKPSDKREISGDILGLGTEEEKKLLKEGAGRKIIIKKAPRTNHVLGDIAKDNIGRKS